MFEPQQVLRTMVATASAGLLSGAAGGEAEAAAPFVFEVDKAYSGKRWDGVRREWVDDTE